MINDNRVGELVVLIRELDALLPWQTEHASRIRARMTQLADSLDPEHARPERPSERVMRLASKYPAYRRD